VSSAVAARPRPSGLAAVRAVPAWAWLAGLVVASALVRYAFARRMVAPWIFVDELVYSELAKSFADSGRFEIREHAVGAAYGVVYPILLSPAYRLFDAVPDAYAAAKVVNAAVMSLAAVPAYLLARRVLSPVFALVVAGLTLLVPSMFYVGTLMTENAFYGLFLLAALALVRVLERPTVLRSLALLAVVGVAFLTRAQAIALLPAIVTAPLGLALLRRRAAVLRAFVPLYATLLLGLVALLGAVLASGRSPRDLLGAYRATSQRDYDAGEAARWLLYHVAELDLYVGVAPFAAFLLLLLSPSRLRACDGAFLAAATALTAWLAVQVAIFASQPSVQRVEERNLFYVAPLFAIALLLWIERGLPRGRLALGVCAVAAILPALLPYERLIAAPAVSDTLALLPLWSLHEAATIPLDRIWVVVLLGAAVIAALVLVVPRRLALVLPALVAALALVAVRPIEARTREASVGALFQGITTGRRDWIDRAVGRDAHVAALWSAPRDDFAFTVWENEFFNRSVGEVLTLRGALTGALAQTPLVLERRTGLFLDPAGEQLDPPYALVDDSVLLAGRIVARDARKGLSVVAVDPPLGLSARAEGVYPDTWSGSRVTYTRYRCYGGLLVVTLESDAALLRRPQTVAALGGPSIRVRPGRTARLHVLMRPSGTRCEVRFTVSPTAVPGGGDTRRLGIHFRRFDFLPR